jgi:sialate O-acetylesterase
LNQRLPASYNQVVGRREEGVTNQVMGNLMCKSRLLAILIALGLAAPTSADVKLATLFRDGMVLQRDKPAPIWGWADPGEHITVSFAKQSKSATADASGRWMIRLDPLNASSTPDVITVAGKTSVVVKGVLVGDVWLCSGQSNMNLPLSATQGAKEEIARARSPLIRYFEVKSSILEEPTDTAEGDWQECSPNTAGSFTAVGYYFAREIQPQLNVPVGIIKATLGGSPIEGWIGADVMASTPAATPSFQAWEGMKRGYIQRAEEYQTKLAAWKLRHKDGTSSASSDDPRPVRAWVDSDRNKPSGLYNGFIYPLEPFALAGVLWYQGEGNVPRAAEYKVLFPLMISQWRRDFHQPDLPFLFVQLPGYEQKNDPTGESWPRLREAQIAALKLPGVGMAVTTDIGDPIDLHPPNKRDVGKRLSLIALKQVHHRDVEDSGPIFQKAVRSGDALHIRFTNAEGLALRGDSNQAFTIAGADRKFLPAQARIENDRVILTATGVPKPVAARLNWVNNPKAWLVNKSGLPAAPFRSDDW